MRLLVLGGTGFVGGATVTEALRRGWSVTVFNRGLHGAVPDRVRRLRGDRSAPDGLSALAGGEWDWVVDTWDGEPRAVLNAARALVGSTGHYVYVSSRVGLPGAGGARCRRARTGRRRRLGRA
jgi:2'-hydroxyisoflavone reductase